MCACFLHTLTKVSGTQHMLRTQGHLVSQASATLRTPHPWPLSLCPAGGIATCPLSPSGPWEFSQPLSLPASNQSQLLHLVSPQPPWTLHLSTTVFAYNLTSTASVTPAHCHPHTHTHPSQRNHLSQMKSQYSSQPLHITKKKIRTPSGWSDFHRKICKWPKSVKKQFRMTSNEKAPQ